MAVVFQFWGNQVGTVSSINDDGNGNTTLEIYEMPFLATDRVLITISNESFDEYGEFLLYGDIHYTEVRVIRDGVTYDLSVDSGSKIKESGNGSNKEQGDSFFLTNDSIGPASSGPFSGIPEDQYVFVTGTTLSTSDPVTIPRLSGENGNSNFDIENGLSNLICFAGGTRIRTPNGEVPVECLDVGDLVETMDNGAQPIRWINNRRLDIVAKRFRPILIRANAFGDAPYVDLELSPQHRVMLESFQAELLFGDPQVLTAAQGLVNNAEILVRKPKSGITFFHFCFDAHQIVFANGLPCESLFPGQTAISSLAPEPLAELNELFPDLADAPSPSGMQTARPVLRRFETELLVNTAPDLLAA